MFLTELWGAVALGMKANWPGGRPNIAIRRAPRERDSAPRGTPANFGKYRPMSSRNRSLATQSLSSDLVQRGAQR